MQTANSSPLFSYGIAIAAPVVAAAATGALWTWLHPAVSLFFFPAVIIAALYGGLVAGLIATGLSVFLAAFFFIPPMYSFSMGVADFTRLVIFSTGAIVTASLTAARKRAEMKQWEAIVELNRALDEVTRLSEGLERSIAERTADLEASNRALQEEIAERARLSERLVQVQETERRQLARELHDQVGQTLTGLKLRLEAMSRGSRGTSQHDTIEPLELVDSLMFQIREISLDLRPSVLDDLGLVPALLWHFDRYSAQTGVHVNFTQTGVDERLATEVETAAFRIVQEALTNVARHASVSEAAVWLRKDGRELCVIIEDAGCGFDWDGIVPFRSSGLTGMRERAVLLGGQFTVQAIPAAGTRVTAVFPLRAPAGTVV
jgi:signal transduction histidine kinase